MIFFAKKAFHIQIVHEKVKNWTKNGQKPSQKIAILDQQDEEYNITWGGSRKAPESNYVVQEVKGGGKPTNRRTRCFMEQDMDGP